MSIKRLRERVPSARFVSIATLHAHELRFHKKSVDGSGKCDAYATQNNEHAVIGVVCEIKESEKPQLDRKEGLGNGYEEKTVDLVLQTGKFLTAFTYYATNIEQGLIPYKWYKHHVLTGAQENGLPEIYVAEIQNIDSTNDPNEERHKREMAIYTSYSRTL